MRITKTKSATARTTIIIPYKVDRGWLKDAINSVPKDCQLLVSQGDGNWPENFNKVLDQATGDYIRWLHEDDMLTPNCITDSINAIEQQGVDFIHGNAMEFFEDSDKKIFFHPWVKIPTVQDLLKKNPIHSATLMYKRKVFDELRLDETLNTAEEYEFNLRVLKNGFKIGYCDATLAYYRRHPQQKVRVVSSIEKNKERELVKAMYR
jgi:GT2 family glycosyltransferase